VAVPGTHRLVGAHPARREHAHGPGPRGGEEAEPAVLAERDLGDDGGFRFFAAPGTWTVRVLAPGGVSTDETVTADYGRRTAVEVTV